MPMEKDNRSDKAYAFFSHKTCEYFPCHKTDNPDEFNCLFCYCPLYSLGSECGGNPTYMKSGIKNCSDCCFPHKKDNYGLVMKRLTIVLDKAKKEN